MKKSIVALLIGAGVLTGCMPQEAVEPTTTVAEVVTSIAAETIVEAASVEETTVVEETSIEESVEESAKEETVESTAAKYTYTYDCELPTLVKDYQDSFGAAVAKAVASNVRIVDVVDTFGLFEATVVLPDNAQKTVYSTQNGGICYADKDSLERFKEDKVKEFMGLCGLDLTDYIIEDPEYYKFEDTYTYTVQVGDYFYIFESDSNHNLLNAYCMQTGEVFYGELVE